MKMRSERGVMSRRMAGWFAKLGMLMLTAGCTMPAATCMSSYGTCSHADTILYAAVGSTLVRYGVAVAQANLTKCDSVELPAAIQYAWPSPSNRYLYVVWSGSPTDPASLHGATAFELEPGSGKLHQIGKSIPLKYRPIHVTTDQNGTHLLIVYNKPAGVSVYRLMADGSVGQEVRQPANLDVGIYVHQVRVESSNHTVTLMARGNYEHRQDPGAIKIFDYDNGLLANRTSIAPGGGRNFNPRDVDFGKFGHWAFVTLEAQDKLQVYRLLHNGSLAAAPLFSVTTLAKPSDVSVEHRQLTGTVHLHPNGRVVYSANRATGTVKFQGKEIWGGGENSIAVFRINLKTGEPTLIQTADTRGMVPRTFALDPHGRLLVAANQNQRLIREGTVLKTVPESLALFRVEADGKLKFARIYKTDGIGNGNLFWMGIMAVPH